MAGDVKQMSADEERALLNVPSEQVIGCAFAVSSALGTNFLEKVYENALVIELQEAGLQVEQQRSMTVMYKGRPVGEFAVDLLVEGRLVLELKAVPALEEAHTAQCLNYLRASGLKLCLLLNFGTPRLKVKRVVYNF